MRNEAEWALGYNRVLPSVVLADRYLRSTASQNAFTKSLHEKSSRKVWDSMKFSAEPYTFGDKTIQMLPKN